VRSVLDFLFSPWPSRLLREHDVSVDEVILVKTTWGDKVIVPPNYGHVTLNPSEKTLKMASWVFRSFESLYEPYTQHHGGRTMNSSTAGFCRTGRTTRCLRSKLLIRSRCLNRDWRSESRCMS
jgi:oxalate decarboxylase/phosphoglucose isomerase-like protein (cupin superfamily)